MSEQHEATPLLGMHVIVRSVPGIVTKIVGDSLIVTDEGGVEWNVRSEQWRQWLARMVMAKVTLPKEPP